jgi:hypothetical protein
MLLVSAAVMKAVQCADTAAVALFYSLLQLSRSVCSMQYACVGVVTIVQRANTVLLLQW